MPSSYYVVQKYFLIFKNQIIKYIKKKHKKYLYGKGIDIT
jgi:hypothetical protein